MREPEDLTPAQDMLRALMPKASPKYRNQPVVVDGHRFPSQWEAEVYGHVLLWQRVGLIAKFALQRRYELSPGVVYVGDFTLWRPDDAEGVLDAKGTETAMFKVKSKLFRAAHPGIPLFTWHRRKSHEPLMRWLREGEKPQ